MSRKPFILFDVFVYCLLIATAVNAYEKDGINSTSHTIIGGEIIEKGSRPYLVAIGSGDKGEFQYCGGSLISPHAVLTATAAHCVFDKTTGKEWDWDAPDWVEFNRYDKCDDTGVVRIRMYLDRTQCDGDIVYHSGFSIDTFDYDVAVLFLPTAVTDNITPVTLNTDPNVPTANAPLDVAGWGDDAYGDKPSVPFATTVNYLSNEVCTAPPYKELTEEVTEEQMMCAYAKKTDSCQGDSGKQFVLCLIVRDS